MTCEEVGIFARTRFRDHSLSSILDTTGDYIIVSLQNEAIHLSDYPKMIHAYICTIRVDRDIFHQPLIPFEVPAPHNRPQRFRCEIRNLKLLKTAL